MRTLPPPAKSAPALHLTERLELEDVHYAYPLADRPALRGISLAIAARSTVGIVGGTGAGKTTAVDIVLGLLMPDRGTLSSTARRSATRTCAPGSARSATCRSRSS